MPKAKQTKVINKQFGYTPEKIGAASPSRPACAECQLYDACDTPFMVPYVPDDWSGLFLFVVEPSRLGATMQDGVPVSEIERKELKKVLARVGVTRNDVAFVPAVRCQSRAKMKMTPIRGCRPFLLQAVQKLNAKHVLLCGETAARAWKNSGAPGTQGALRGRELPLVALETQAIGQTKVAFSTIKLSALGTDPHAKNRLAEDMTRLLSKPVKYPGTVIASDSKCVSFDTEYSAGRVFTMAVGTVNGAVASEHPGFRPVLTQIKSKTLVGHNVWVDLESLLLAQSGKFPGIKKSLDTWLQGLKVRDTSLEARLVDENRGPKAYKLESLVTSFYNVKDWKEPTEALGPDSSQWPKHLRQERCRLDAWATALVHEHLKDKVEGPSKLSHQIAASLRRMYWTGVYIDAKKFKSMVAHITQEQTKAVKVLNTFAKKMGLVDFTATKDDSLRQYVYGENGVGLEAESFTKGGLPTVSVKALKEYKDDPRISALLTFSKWDKLLTTYCGSFEAKFQKQKDGLWIPVQVNPLAAKTGRRTSNGPNWQNLPPFVRQIVVSRFRKGVIADNDYSKLEPILGGWVTHEPRLTEYFTKYPNGYIKIGTDFFKKTVEKNTDEYKAVKSLILAVIYNKKKWSLAEDLWVNHGVKLAPRYDDHEEKSGEILNRFLNELFPGVKVYQRDTEEEVLSNGVIYNALGQARRLPLPPEPPRSEKMLYRVWMKYKAHVINQAINYKIQSLAAYVTGCAMIDLERAFLTEYKFSYSDYHEMLMRKEWPQMPLVCIEVHDDLVQDIPKGLEKKTKEMTHAVMSKPPSLVDILPELFDSNVKLTVDTNVAERWGLKG